MAAVADYVITANPNLRTQAAGSPEARQRLRQMFLDVNSTGYAHTIRALLTETFPPERLSILSMPTLVLVGDEYPALEAARLTHQQVPGARLVILPPNRAALQRQRTGVGGRVPGRAGAVLAVVGRAGTRARAAHSHHHRPAGVVQLFAVVCLGPAVAAIRLPAGGRREDRPAAVPKWCIDRAPPPAPGGVLPRPGSVPIRHIAVYVPLAGTPLTRPSVSHRRSVFGRDGQIPGDHPEVPGQPRLSA